MSGSLSSCCCCHPVGIPCPAWSGCRWMLFTPGSNPQIATGTALCHTGASPVPSLQSPRSSESLGPLCVIQGPLQYQVSRSGSSRATGTALCHTGASPVPSLQSSGPQELLGPLCVIQGPHQCIVASPQDPQEPLGPLCVIQGPHQCIVSIPGVEDLQCHNEREKLAAVHQQWTMSIAQCAHLRM